MKEHKKIFLFILSISAIRLLIVPLFHLVPQEAYYWLYIQEPALGYFDHPPMCSYTIGIFTWLFGNHEFGVRFGMVLYSIGTMMITYFFTLDLFQKRNIARLAVYLLNGTIFFNITSLIATPDTPLLFFWSLTLYFLYKAVFVEKKRFSYYWIFTGLSAGFALQSKYTAGFILFSSLIFFLFSKRFRFYLFTPYPYISAFFAFVVFSPVIYWNYSNGWASFLFQSADRASGMVKLNLNYFFQLFFSQLYELGPLLFVVFSSGVIYLFKDFYLKLKERMTFLFVFSIPVIIFFIVISFTSLVKMNWLQPAYITLIIAVSYYFQKKISDKLYVFLKNISIILIVLNLFMIIVPVVPIKKGDTWNGWGELSHNVDSLYHEMKVDNDVFIFGNRYKVAAEIAFYTNLEEFVYAQNIYGMPALQFDFRKSPEFLIGQDGIFVFSDFEKMKEFHLLEIVFDNIELVREIKIQYYQDTPVLNKIYKDVVFRRFYIYKCMNYKGIKQFF